MPVVEEGTEGVRIMTVHRAKGLEFPVVMLADLTCNETAATPIAASIRNAGFARMRLAGHAPRELLEHAEEETPPRPGGGGAPALCRGDPRARLLIVPGGRRRSAPEGWLARLNPRDLSRRARWRAPLEPRAARMSRISATIASSCARPRLRAKSRGVAPGCIAPRPATIRWCGGIPAQLKLDARETMGLRQHRLLTADEGERAASQGAREYERWKAAAARCWRRAAAETYRVVTATELAARIVERGERPAMARRSGSDRDRARRARAARPHGAALRHAGPCDTFARRARCERGGDRRGGPLFCPDARARTMLEIAAACEAAAAALSGR